MSIAVVAPIVIAIVLAALLVTAVVTKKTHPHVAELAAAIAETLEEHPDGSGLAIALLGKLDSQAVKAVVADAFKIVLALALVVGLQGCASMPQVQPADLDRLTLDLQRLHDGIAAIDTGALPEKVGHALDDVRTVSGKAVTVSDLLSRVARGAQ